MTCEILLLKTVLDFLASLRMIAFRCIYILKFTFGIGLQPSCRFHWVNACMRTV